MYSMWLMYFSALIICEKFVLNKKNAVKTTGFFSFAIGRWKMCNMKKNNNKLQFCIIASLCVLYTVLYFCVPYTVLYRYIVNEVRPKTKLSSLV